MRKTHHRKANSCLLLPSLQKLGVLLLFVAFLVLRGVAAEADSSLGPWAYTTSLQTARAGHGMAAGTNSLYVIGGHNGAGTTLSSVEYATIAPNGLLSAWQFTVPLNVPRALTTAAATATHVYVIGGAQSWTLIGLELASVEYAPILPDGSLGSWSLTSPLTANRANAVALVHGNFLYVVGGYGNGQLDTIERAEILSDGTLGPWSVLPSRLTVPRERPGAAIAASMMVVMGGFSAASGGIVKTTEFAPVLLDGSVGGWQSGPLLSLPRYHLSAVGLGASVFVLGGYNDQPIVLATTEEATVNSAGPGTWISGSPMQEIRAELAAAVAGGYVYVSGGTQELPNLPRSIIATVERAAVAPLDRDNDGIPDEEEPCICLQTPPNQVVTALGCSINQVCPCDAPLGREAWRNHAEYVQCVIGAVAELVADGVLTKNQQKAIVRQADRSACGR